MPVSNRDTQTVLVKNTPANTAKATSTIAREIRRISSYIEWGRVS